MSIPPDEPRPAEREPEARDQEPVEGARSTHPLVWLLLLIALAAIAWYFASHDQAPEIPPAPAAPAEQAADTRPAVDDGEAAPWVVAVPVDFRVA